MLAGVSSFLKLHWRTYMTSTSPLLCALSPLAPTGLRWPDDSYAGPMTDKATLRPGRAAALTAMAALGLACAQAAPGLTGLPVARRHVFPRLSGAGDAGHVALTFDDGPDPLSTPRFAALLAERGVRATFFMLGSMAARAPGLAAELAQAGHEIGVHGFDHRYLPARGSRAAWSDLRRTTELLTDLTGRRLAYFRPPYGVLSGPALIAARRLHLTPVLWGCWGREWTPGATAASVYRTLAHDLRGGVTVLLHDSGCTSPPGAWQAGLGALPLLLDECNRRGLRVGPFGEHRS